MKYERGSVKSDHGSSGTDIDNLDGKEVILNHVGILFECCAAIWRKCQFQVHKAFAHIVFSWFSLSFSLWVILSVLLRHSNHVPSV